MIVYVVGGEILLPKLLFHIVQNTCIFYRSFIRETYWLKLETRVCPLGKT